MKIGSQSRLATDWQLWRKILWLISSNLHSFRLTRRILLTKDQIKPLRHMSDFPISPFSDVPKSVISMREGYWNMMSPREQVRILNATIPHMSVCLVKIQTLIITLKFLRGMLEVSFLA